MQSAFARRARRFALTIVRMRELRLPDDLYLFTRVALSGTLSAVARERVVPVSQISRTLARV